MHFIALFYHESAAALYSRRPKSIWHLQTLTLLLIDVKILHKKQDNTWAFTVNINWWFWCVAQILFRLFSHQASPVEVTYLQETHTENLDL